MPAAGEVLPGLVESLRGAVVNKIATLVANFSKPAKASLISLP